MYSTAMLLAFFPEHMLRSYREPTLDEMIRAYRVLREAGLKNVRVGNVGVLCKTVECVVRLISVVGREAVAL